MEIVSQIKVEKEDVIDSLNNDNESTIQWNNEQIISSTIKCESEKIDYCDAQVKIEQENVETKNNIIHGKFTCKYCGITFALRSFYQNHSRYCQAKYISKFGRLIELEESFEDRRFSCFQCGYKTNDSGNLKRHALTHSGVKPYKCSFCSYSAIQKISLQRHINYKHNKDKVHACDQCSYKSTNSRDVKRHKIVHAKNKPFVCEICKKNFNQNRYLEAHMYKHTGKEKPHECSQCNYRTEHENNLKKHIKIKHCKLKLNSCEICSLKFALPETLKRHMNSHKKDKPYKCRECPVQFIMQGKFINHMKKKHLMDITMYKIKQ